MTLRSHPAKVKLQDEHENHSQGPQPPPSDKPPSKTFLQSVCGKTILIGEHAVIYGAKAIAMPVQSLQMKLKLEALADSEKGSIFNFGNKSASPRLKSMLTDAFSLLGVKPFPVKVEGLSNILIGSGLGSSASLSVALLLIISQAMGQTLTPQKVAILANELEKSFHGTPSGLDTSVVAYNKIISFKKGEPNEIELLKVAPIKDTCETPWPFVLVDSKIRSSTIAMVKQTSKFFRGQEGERRVALFDSLASHLQQALQGGDIQNAAAAISEASRRLAECNLVTQPIDHLIKEIKSLGALSAKLTGAGAGGCVLALLDPRYSKEQLNRMQQHFGHDRVFWVPLGNDKGQKHVIS